ncbi:MAG TPA: hypothetical protein VGM39_20205 [Kofleriaceae bacterium]|jgi:hypothetical protein
MTETSDAALTRADTPIVLTGLAYQRRATLEVRGDTLMWRAQKGQLYPDPENIATTTFDVRDVMWMQRRGSIAAAGLGIGGAIALANDLTIVGVIGLALGLALAIYRLARPLRWLGLNVGGRWLLLRVERTCADEARLLAERIEQNLKDGDVPREPLALP